MDIMEYYRLELTGRGLIEEEDYSLSDNITRGLREFFAMLERRIPSIVSKQENAVIIHAEFENDINQSEWLKSSGGNNKIREFLYDILNLFAMELTSIWTIPWATTKILANTLQPPPAGAGFPPYLYYTAPAPVGAAIGGCNLPFIDVSSIVGLKNTPKYQFAEITDQVTRQKLMLQIDILLTAIGKYIAEQYVNYATTGPKPYLAP